MTGFDVPISLENFEAVLHEVKPTIVFICDMNHERFKDHDWDDLYQIFSIKLWDMIKRDKLPSDMKFCDFRFRRYCQTVFMFEMGQMFRKKINRGKWSKGIILYRDYYDASFTFTELENHTANSMQHSPNYGQVLEIRQSSLFVQD